MAGGRHMEIIVADQSYYMEKVNHVNRRQFDRNISNISTCNPVGFQYLSSDKALYFLTLTYPMAFNGIEK